MRLEHFEIKIVLNGGTVSLQAQCIVKPDTGNFPADTSVLDLDEHVEDGIKQMFRDATDKLTNTGIIQKLLEKKYDS